jgi:hypothetical protein
MGLGKDTVLKVLNKNVYVDKGTFNASSPAPFSIGTLANAQTPHYGSVLAWANGTHNGCPTRSGPFNNCCWLKIESVVGQTGLDSDEWDYSHRHLYPPNNTVYVPCYWRVEDNDEELEQ